MAYLLIVLVLAVILSPLMSLRSSPRQKLITSLRRHATEQGLQVKLSTPPGSREGEGRMESVIYRFPWPQGSEPSAIRRAEQWLLIRNVQRGDASLWQGWHWLTLQPSAELMPVIGQFLEDMNEDVKGLEAGPEGLSLYWNEHGVTDDVENISAALKRLCSAIRP